MKKKIKKKIIKAIMGGVIIVGVVTSVVFGINGKYLNADAWLGYIATLIGITISGAVSFYVLYLTIEQNFDENEKDRIKSVTPVLKVTGFLNNPNNESLNVNYNVEKERDREEIKFEISNIGTGPAINTKIKLGDYYAKNMAGRDNVIDLGVNESMGIAIKTNDWSSILEDLGAGKVINTILECDDIYEKRRYNYYFKIIKPNDRMCFEVYEKDKCKVTKI